MILVIGTHKGGAGKSTLAVNLAVAAALDRHTPILVDADPIATSSRWASDREEARHPPTIPAVQKSGNVAGTLRDLDARYSHVIVDVAGRDSRELRTAMAVADRLLVPCQTSQPDLDVLPEFNDVIAEAKDLNPDLDARIVFNRVSTNRGSRGVDEAVEYLAAAELEHLSPARSALHDRKAYGDVFSEGLGVLEFTNAKARAEVRALAKEIL